MLSSGGVLEGALHLDSPGVMPRGPVSLAQWGCGGQEETYFGIYIDDVAASCFLA